MVAASRVGLAACLLLLLFASSAQSITIVTQPAPWSTLTAPAALTPNGQSSVTDIAMDKLERVYTVGVTTRTNYAPLTWGPYTAPTVTGPNLFLAIYDPTGSTLLYFTYLREHGTTEPLLALNQHGDVFIAINSWHSAPLSGIYPKDPGPWDDIYLAHLVPFLNPTHIDETYFGGPNDHDIPYALVWDERSGQLLLGGMTCASALPEGGSYAIVPNGAAWCDGFLATFSPDLGSNPSTTHTLTIAGFEGIVRGLVLDPFTNDRIMGLHPGAGGPPGGALLLQHDGFATVATVTIGPMNINDMAIHPMNGHIVVGGTTWGGTFSVPIGGPVTGPLGGSDGFVAWFDVGLAPLGATFVGGSLDDDVLAVGIHHDVITIGGSTYSPNLNTVQGAGHFHQPLRACPLLGPCPADGMLQRIRYLIPQVVASTYIGGDGGDAVTSLAVPPGPTYRAAGGTTSTPGPGAFPTSAGSYSPIGDTGPSGWLARPW